MTDDRDENLVAEAAVPVDNMAPFRTALNWVAAAWAVGAVFVGGACLFAAATAAIDPLSAAVISIGSGLIAGGAMLSGALLLRMLCPPNCPGDSGPAGSPAAALLAATAAGMFLRLVGTVALFLTCRYHLAASVEWIGSMTVGWYLYLTTVEVTALVRELKRIDHAPRATASQNLDQSPDTRSTPLSI